MNPIAILAAICIVCGALLGAVQEDKTIALMLVGAATVTLIPALLKQQEQVKQATKDAYEARRKADEAFEETATLRKDLLEPKRDQ